MYFKYRLHAQRKSLDAIFVTCLVLFSIFGHVEYASGQQVQKLRCARRDVGIAMDSSGSIISGPQISPFRAMQTFVMNVIGWLESGWDLEAVIQFSEISEVVFNFTTFPTKEEEYKEIDNMVRFNENTNMAQVFRYLRTITFAPGNGERPNVPNIALMITDGRANMEVNNTFVEVQRLKDSGVTIFVIGVTTEPSISELTSIASRPDYVFSATDFDTLISLRFLTTVMDAMCTPDPRPASCQNALDIVFILDQSSSITFSGENLFWSRDILGFTSNLILSFNITQNITRVGMVKFSNSAFAPFTLLDYTSITTLVPAVRAMPIEGGQTNIAAGFKIARTDVFDIRRGYRPNVVNVAVLVTDGESNIDRDSTVIEANNLKAIGVELFVVGISSSVNVNELSSVSSLPLDTHLIIEGTFPKLDNIWKQMSYNICQAVGEPTTTTSSVAMTTPTTG